MATVVAFVPDLLFGSSVQASVRAAGHECRLLASVDGADLTGADAVIIDLTVDPEERLRSAATAIASMPTLAFYSHVEGAIRTAAIDAGVSIVVPRSRMARDGVLLVQRLVEGGEPTAPHS
jgi:hypothetical protein